MGALSSVATRTTSPATTGVAQLKQLLTKKASDISAILGGDQQRFEKFRSNVVRLYSQGELSKCSPVSVLGAAMQAAYLNLDLDPNLGQAYVIARWNGRKRVTEATFQVGYKGLIDLVRRSGQLVDLYANIVYENEPFSYRYTVEGVQFEHEPLPPSKRGPQKIGVYMVAKLKEGFHFEFMWAEEVEEIKKLSQSGSKGFSPWNANPVSEEAMWKKTVIRRGMKFLPMSTELQRLITIEEAEEVGKSVDFSRVIDEGVDAVVIEDDTKTPDHNPQTGEVKEEPVAKPAVENPSTEELQPVRVPAIQSLDDLTLYLEDIGVTGHKIVEEGGRTYLALEKAPDNPATLQKLVAAGFGKKGSRVLRDVTELMGEAATLFG